MPFCVLPEELQNGLHSDFQRLQAAGFIETDGVRIAAPDVERHMIAALLPREAPDMFIQLPADPAAARRFIHAQVIQIQLPELRPDIVVPVLPEDAEGVAQHPAVPGRHKDRTRVVADQVQQLTVCIFGASGPEEVGAAAMVNEIHLQQKTVEIGQILFCRSSDLHQSNPPFRRRRRRRYCLIRIIADCPGHFQQDTQHFAGRGAGRRLFFPQICATLSETGNGGFFMTFWEYYLRYTGEILDGSRPGPEGIVLTETEETARAVELFRQIEAMGIQTFVRACADLDGEAIPQEVYDAFRPEELQELLSALPRENAETGRSAYEVLLDCCCLDERLVAYLIQVLKDGDELGFFRLAQITARTEIRPGPFLAWIATLEERAPEEERACAILMDACFDRLLSEGKGEVAAALLSGDQQTFELFRCEAPELRSVPAATFDWYARNYLDRSYPVRVLLRANGVALPRPHRKEAPQG